MLTLMFNTSVLGIENKGVGIFAGAADNGMAPPSSVPEGEHGTERESGARVSKSEIKSQRKSKWRRANNFHVN